MPDVDVAVIGAGLSGLIAARELESAGVSVVVIEGADRIGGKLLTVTVGPDHVDLGAHWVGPTHHRVWSLARQLGVERQAQPLEGKQLMKVGDQLVDFKAGLPALGALTLADIALGRIKLWWEYRNADFDAQTSTSWADRSGTDLGRRLFRTSVARDIFRQSIELMLGVHPDDVSALHLLQYIKAGGGTLFLSSFKGGAQQEFFVGGAQQLSTKLADSLASEVVLGHQVDSVSQDASGVVIRAGERSWTARKAIFAVAPPMLDSIDFTPTLAPAIARYARDSKLGAYSKFVAVFDTPWWRDQGLSGIAQLTDGPLRMIVDGAAQSGRGILIGFSVANEAAHLSALPEAERRSIALRALASVFGPAALEPIDYIDFHWSQDHFAQGAPAAFLPPHAAASTLPPRPDQNLFWAGTDIAVAYNGYLEGAIESGMRAAEEALAALPERVT
jgi:monoamine oxidase